MTAKTTKITMTTEEFETVRRAIYATWNYIGWDCEEAVGNDNEGALEACLDADRLTLSFDKENGKKAEAILRPLYDTVGFTRVIKYLNRKIRLV